MRHQSIRCAVLCWSVAIACQSPGGGGGTAGTATATPNPLDFGPELVGGAVVASVKIQTHGSPSFVGGGASMGGADRKYFQLTGPDASGSPKDTTIELSFIFDPDTERTFNATYKFLMVAGSADSVELTGKGVFDLEYGKLGHHGTYPSGYDYGDVCIGASADFTFTVTNTSGDSAELLLTWRPPVGAFDVAPGVKYIQTAPKHGTASWILRYTPSSPPKEETTGALVQVRTTHNDRAGVVLKGKGKNC